MYDEAADFAEHAAQLDAMHKGLAACKVAVAWPDAVICDVGGGGGLRAALLSNRVRRSYCADIIDQQLRYGGEFVRLLAEKLARHGHTLAIDRFEFNVTDATVLLYKDGLFDFVYSFKALEHIREPERALREISRVLRPDGLAYVSFDPIWTADTGSHFQHRVKEPWAHLVLGDDAFVERMRAAGADDWEINEFKSAMNRVRLREYVRLFEAVAPSARLEVLDYQWWSGVTDETHRSHENLGAALKQSYSMDELMTRGISAVLRKRT